MPRLHAAALADIPVIRGRTGRIRRLALRDRSFGASGECQDDQERAKSSSPVHYVTLPMQSSGRVSCLPARAAAGASPSAWPYVCLPGLSCSLWPFCSHEAPNLDLTTPV
jgi:hypothetical protein